MKLFFFSTDDGFGRHVFAADRDRAAELFLAHQVLNDVRPGDFWCEGVTLEGLQQPARSHLRRALGLGIDGIGTYDEASGWRIQTPAREEVEPD